MSTFTVNTKSFTNSLRNSAVKVDREALDSMLASIGAALVERDTFETRDNTVSSGNAWLNARKRIAANANALARLFIVANVTDARNVICRKLSVRSMFTAYGLDKMVEVANLVCGNSTKMQVVAKAFVACCIVATDNGMTVLDNTKNKMFLKHGGLTAAQVTDEDVREILNGFTRSHSYNSEDSQSSQMRNVLEVLGFCTMHHDERARGAISIDVRSPFMRLFRSTYMHDVSTKVEREAIDA